MPSLPPRHRPCHCLSRQQADRAYEQRRALDPALAAAKRIRNGSRWQHVRRAHLQRSPLCLDCKVAGCTRAAVDVDHVIPLVTLVRTNQLQLAYDETNLRSLCRACHSKKSARERRSTSR